MEPFLSCRWCDGFSRRPALLRILGRALYCYVILIYNFSSNYIISLELPEGRGPQFILHWTHIGTYSFSIFLQSKSHLPIDPTPSSCHVEFDLFFFLPPQCYVQLRSALAQYHHFYKPRGECSLHMHASFLHFVSVFLGVSHINILAPELFFF
jgi:hypothetical protein